MACHNCDVCKRTFKRKVALNIHKTKSHFKDEISKCDLCSEKFQCKRNLRRHVLEIHGRKRPFKCHLCDTRFIQELAYQNILLQFTVMKMN